MTQDPLITNNVLVNLQAGGNQQNVVVASSSYVTVESGKWENLPPALSTSVPISYMVFGHGTLIHLYKRLELFLSLSSVDGALNLAKRVKVLQYPNCSLADLDLTNEVGPTSLRW